MLKGVKGYSNGNIRKADNRGDGIYELRGKWRSQAKRVMHKLFRVRNKRLVSQLIKEDVNSD